MAYFFYTARDKSGESINGDMESDSASLVADSLVQQGLTPVKIKQGSDPSAQSEEIDTTKIGSFFESKVTLDEIIMLCRQLRTLMRAGVPILRGLQGLADTVENSKLAAALQDIQHQLQSGLSFSAALAKHGNLFSPLFVALVRIGEETGQLDKAFAHLADYLNEEKSTREKIKAATRYPATVFSAIFVAIVIINVWVVPSFASTFQRYGADLPIFTQILMTTSDVFVYGWPYVLPLLIAAVVGLKVWIKTEEGEYQWAKFMINLPLVGSILRKATLARFCQSLSMVMRAGVPLAQGLSVVADVVNNAYVSRSVMQMRESIVNGESVTRAASATGLFTPLVLQMMAVGEETGALDELLEETATHYQAEIAYEVSRLSESIEPIVIVVIGIMVTVLALGVFLPMWDMASVSRGG